MSETTQATLMDDTVAGGHDDPDAERDTIDDDGLLDKVRDSEHPAIRCGYCHEVALKGYETSAHGRDYCPECETVKAADQRDSIPKGVFWT